MKKQIFIAFALLSFGIASAQTDPEKPKPVTVNVQRDSITSNQQIQKEADLKTMDAVKTQDHAKPVKKQLAEEKKNIKSKDSTRRATRNK